MSELDEGRLLTEEEFLLMGYDKDFETKIAIAVAQDTKTAAIKDAECQARVERIIITAEEGMARIAGFISREEMLSELGLPEYWQALKEGRMP